MKLGVFDSGVGGKAVAESLRLAFPHADIVTANDIKHVPYGSRPAAEIVSLTSTAIRPLLIADCDCIVIACNTATMLALPTLRKLYPNQKFIGIEPMVKPAAKLTKSNTFAVCATPATLASSRYQELKTLYAEDKTIIEPDCSDWAYMIENNTLDKDKIKQQINNALLLGADVIVLGCTHYHWIKDLIELIADKKAIVLEPSEAIARQVRNLLEA